MNKIKQTLFWCVAFTVFTVFQTNQTFAQDNITVKGKVVDSSNEPLIGVSIGVGGGKGGTRTDVNGDFQLLVPAGTKALKFSYIGFDIKSVPVSANMKVELKTSTNTLDDVVVTGYSQVKKKDLTGAITNITSKDFNQGNVTNSILQIQGKVAGLSIVQSTGDANEAPTIRLRGQTSLFGGQNPLIVVDGVQLNGANDLSLIPPGDIASYDVLKDASATSIYGSRGANGVIIVTTKRGVSGQARVEYQGTTSLDMQAKYVDLLSADQWRVANPTYTNDADFSSTANTNWQKAMTRPAATQNHAVSLSGGAKGFSYSGSINYIGQDNIIINSGREQLGIRFNAQQKALNDKLDLQVSISNSITNSRNIDFGGTDYRFIPDLSPALPVYNADGTYNQFIRDVGNVQNRVQIQNEKIARNRRNFTTYAGSAKYEIITGLKAGVAGTFASAVVNENSFFPTFNGQPNNARRGTSTTDNYRGEVSLSYDKSFGKHNFSAFSVYEHQFFTNNSFESRALNILFPFFEDNALEISVLNDRSTRSFKAENKLTSLLGRFNYNYDNKYYATISLRRDGSTKFGVNNRWGTFGAANFAWRITEEKFMKDITWINDLKLRVGYGETGNSDGLSEYQSLRLRTFGGIQNGLVTFNITQNENPDLQWEVRRGRNIGLDFALFNSRLSGDINYFNDITDKLLFTYEVASALTVPGNPEGKYVTANVGKLSNKGLELDLNFRAIVGKDFQWTVGGQISGVRTQITTLQDPSGNFQLRTDKIIAGFQNLPGSSGSIPITYLVAGSAPFVFELPYSTGLDLNGNQTFRQKPSFDSEGNPIMVNDTRLIDPTPRFNYGISNSFTYKNINLNFFLRGVSGAKIYNSFASIVESDVDGRLSRGFNTTQSGLSGGINDGVALSDRWLENASFIRLDNASLGYTFRKFKAIQTLRVFVAGNNLFVITKYKGIDPEVQTSSAISAGGTRDNYLDYNAWVPRVRSFSFGINASF